MGKNNSFFKVRTVEQFKILKYINVNFITDSLELELVRDDVIRATDCNGKKILFYYDHTAHKVKTRDKI